MDFLTSTMLSGFTYDLVKGGITFTVETLREKLKGWILKEEDYKKLTDIMNAASESDKKTQKYWEAFLDSDKSIKAILEKAEKNSIVQNLTDNTAQNGGIVAASLNIHTFNNNINSKDDSKKK